MTNFKSFSIVIVSLVTLILMSGCGNSSTNTAAATACATGYTYSSTTLSCLYTGTTSTTCSTGYVYSTTYGTCLQQTTGCAGSYALYNGSCVLYSTTTTTTTTTTTHSPYEGTCTYGYVQTAAGCLPQGVCTTGYGYGNYWCYPTTATY